MLEFILQGVFFFLLAFMFLMVIALIRVGFQALYKWNEER